MKNEILKRAQKINEFGTEIPQLNIGDIVTLADVWDGNGEAPADSYSYPLNDMDWINYSFDIIEDSENPLEKTVKITNIELI